MQNNNIVDRFLGFRACCWCQAYRKPSVVPNDQIVRLSLDLLRVVKSVKEATWAKLVVLGIEYQKLCTSTFGTNATFIHTDDDIVKTV